MQRPWFETIFDERYPELFGPVEGDAEKEVAEILDFLRLPAEAVVEDLGCGRGRHAVRLIDRARDDEPFSRLGSRHDRRVRPNCRRRPARPARHPSLQ